MSQQLDSMLAKLKKAVAEKENEPDAVKKAVAPVSNVDTKAASQALKDFIAKTVVSKGEQTAQDDPKVVAARRKALSDFVGTALTNNGIAAISGTISESSQKNAGKGHGHGGNGHGKSAENHQNSQTENKTATEKPAIPFTPPPAPVVTICPKCIAGENNPALAALKNKVDNSKFDELKAELESVKAELEKTKAEAAKVKAASPAVSGMSGFSTSAPISVSRPVIAEKAVAPASPETPEAAPSTSSAQPPAKKGGVASLFAAFKPGAKSNANEGKPNAEAETNIQAAATVTSFAPVQSAATVAWFKHIQAVESALRIGDVLFADSLLALLMEVSKSLAAEANITARLQSLQARVMLDRKQFAEVEALLNQTIKDLESSPHAKNIAHAYCWHALAVCYQQQKKTEQAESARQKAIEIADAAVGPKDPEALFFKEPLQA